MSRRTKWILALFLPVFIVMGCTDSCYKDESNFADAGDSKSSPADNSTEEASGCRVGDVHYEVSMIHPDKPCLVCTILDDNVTRGWSPLEDGDYCDDGRFCSGEGSCDRGRCILTGNPCPAQAPYCTEQYGGVCSEFPPGFDDDDVVSDDDDDVVLDDDDDCWSCETSLECIGLFGETWGCLDNCCADTAPGSDDDDDAVN